MRERESERESVGVRFVDRFKGSVVRAEGGINVVWRIKLMDASVGVDGLEVKLGFHYFLSW